VKRLVEDYANCLWELILVLAFTQVANHFWSGGFAESDRQRDFYFCCAVDKASEGLSHTCVLSTIHSEVVSVCPSVSLFANLRADL
jgi:hypothetical protein